MGVKIAIRGADETIARMQQLAARLGQPLQPLFDTISPEWVTHMQANIRNQGDASGPFVALAMTTQARRKKLGYGAAAPILQRRGDLIRSIEVLDRSENVLSVGTHHESAALLHFGGETGSTSAIPNALIPARPFVSLSEQAIADTLEMVEAYFLPEPGGAGEAHV